MNSRTSFHSTLRLLLFIICPLLAGPLQAEDEIEKAFRDALYAEEVKGDTEAALKAYQEVGAKFESQRDMAATALFRQAECLRKLGRKDEAAAFYNKVLAQYGDKERVAKLSRENLAALGQPTPDAAPAAALPAGMTEEEATELTRLKVLAENSPDLLDQSGPLTGNPPGNSAPPPLDAAAARGQAAVVAWLLTKLPNPSPERLAKPLASACRNGHLKVCELLIAAGADLKSSEALMLALQDKRLTIVRLLLAKKANPNARRVGTTPLNPFSNSSLHPRFGKKVNEGASREGQNTMTALIEAAGNKDLPPDILAELLAAGADVNAVTVVVQSGDPRRNTGGFDWQGHYSLTPLGAAITTASVEKVKLLLAAKAEVNKPCGDLGASPLLLALATHNKENAAAIAQIVDLFTAAGADWKATLTTGASAALVAARFGYDAGVTSAIKAGVDVNTPDKNNYTPLHAAASSATIVRALLAAGAKPNVLFNWAGEKLTPLSTACTATNRGPGGFETIKALLDAGADPNLGSPPHQRPLSYALNGSIYSQPQWPEAAELLVAKGARPAETPHILSDQGIRPVDDEATIAAFRAIWNAAHRRENARLPHAVWLDDGEAPLRDGTTPVFSPQFCDDSALTSSPSLRMFLSKAWWLLDAHPNIRRDWTKVTVTRLKDGKEEIIPVDVLALIAKSEEKPAEGQKVQIEGKINGDFALQWGDVVSIPPTEGTDPAPSERVKTWCRQDLVVKVCIELPGGGLVTNAVAGGEPLWISTARSGGQNYPTIDRELLLQEAGLSHWPLPLTVKHQHMKENGVMETLAKPMPHCYHGDILTVEPPESSAKMSENALRAGIWLCQSMDGPFWEIPARTTTTGGAAPLGSLLLALMSPHPLPVPFFDWDKAVVRRWNSGEPTGGQDPFAEPAPKKLPAEWTEDKLLAVWSDGTLQPGTVLILPAAKPDSFEPPAELREALTKKFSLNWQMKIGGGPLLDSRWEPRFFRAENKDSRRIWRDLDPGAAGSPVVPSLENLLRAHPNAGEFEMVSGNSGILHPGESGKQIHNFTALLIRSGSQLELKAADRPPPPPAPGTNQPTRRRVTLPTQQ